MGQSFRSFLNTIVFGRSSLSLYVYCLEHKSTLFFSTFLKNHCLSAPAIVILKINENWLVSHLYLCRLVSHKRLLNRRSLAACISHFLLVLGSLKCNGIMKLSGVIYSKHTSTQRHHLEAYVMWCQVTLRIYLNSRTWVVHITKNDFFCDSYSSHKTAVDSLSPPRDEFVKCNPRGRVSTTTAQQKTQVLRQTIEQSVKRLKEHTRSNQLRLVLKALFRII